jgi:hypothetical protein
MSIMARIGIFFIWIGGFLLLIFFLYDGTPLFNLLISGFLLVLFGTILFRKFKPDKKDSGRFRLLRRKKSEDINTDENEETF